MTEQLAERPKKRRWIVKWVVVAVCGFTFIFANYVISYGVFGWLIAKDITDQLGGFTNTRNRITNTLYAPLDDRLYGDDPGARLLTIWWIWCVQQGLGEPVSWRDVIDAVDFAYDNPTCPRVLPTR